MRTWNKNIGQGDLKITIYVISCGRAKTTTTHKVLGDAAKYIVRDSQKQAYIDNGIKNIISFPDELINSYSKVLYHSIKTLDDDVFVFLDDDIDAIKTRTDTLRPMKLDAIYDELIRTAQIMYDLDIGYGFNNPNPQLKLYNAPFQFKGMSGWIKWFNKKRFIAKCDPEVNFCGDLDMELQELLNNRICLCNNYIVCIGANLDTNTGGSNDKFWKQKKQHVNNMRKKWGKYYFYNDYNNKPKIRVKR